MATASRQHLPPCCHGVQLPTKDTPKVRFKSELAKFAVPSAKSDALPRLAAALTDARSALRLDRAGGAQNAAAASRFHSMDEIQQYVSAIGEYLSLVQGFTVTAASLVSDAAPPVTGAGAAANPVATLDPASPQAALTQPLIDPVATGVDMNAPRSKCLSFCNWLDALSNANAYAPNARIETAQTLLASGMYMMNDARVRVDKMLAERVTEIPENELKIAYQLFLHAAGVLDACLRALDCTPQAIGAAASDLSAVPTSSQPAMAAGEDTSGNHSTEDVLEKWREEQRRVGQPPGAEPSAPPLGGASSKSDDFLMLNRLPDLANGRFPQVLAWISLAQAQELVILRGISREFVDYALMAKLSIDVAQRYKETNVYTSRHLPCATSPLAERLQLYSAFKQAYYTAVSCYFQGAACMEKEDARHCAQAIANFKKAAKLIQESHQRKAQFDAKASMRDERDRLFAIKTVYVRAEQVIQRDLDIMTRRNDSIYYERIPEPEPPSEPISLVRAVEFPSVKVHALWHDNDINTCLQFSDPRATAAGSGGQGTPAGTANAGNTQESGPRREGCCGSCVIS